VRDFFYFKNIATLLIIMKQSQLFTKTQKTAPKDEEAINAKLLIQGGFVRKLSAGVYAYLPLGWRVLEKINKIIREEMNAIGGQELLMAALVAKEYWEKSGRWGAKVGYEFKAPTGEEIGLGWTHEEVITYIAANFISSYQDLPVAAYQIQTKFRAEARAKNGVLRGREFMMKDLYSFHADKADLDRYYQEVISAYGKILKRLDLDFRIVEASGGAFTKEYTHEFQVLSPAGEDIIFYCSKCDFSQNKEVAKVKAGDKCPKCGGVIKESAGIEVGNVFRLGTRYSEAFDLKFTDATGNQKLVVMGSYGIGPTRLLGTLVEVKHDERGIIWPASVAPFQAHLLNLKSQDAKIKTFADKIYQTLQKAGVEVLYDDREKVSAGEKFADADLLGIPYRLVVSEKSSPKIEVKERNKTDVKLVTEKELVKVLS